MSDTQPPEDLKIEHLELSRERGIELCMKHPMFARLLEEAAEFFTDQKGINYVEMEMGTHDQLGRLCVTVQRIEGDTPAKKAERAEKAIAASRAECDRLRAELAEARKPKTCVWTWSEALYLWRSGCGTNLSYHARFCPECGGKVEVRT